MKALFLAMLFPVACFAQTTKTPAAKPSTTDCPTWNNKQQANKADYYQSLRHPKSAKAQVVVDPGHVAEKKPVLKPKPEVKKSTIPSFSSGSDPLLEKKKPVEAKTAVQEESSSVTKSPSKQEAKPAVATKEKTEKKPIKKKESANNSGRVRNTKKSAEKCPAF